MKKMICWDMDGTIADLYAIHEWETRLNNDDPSPYAEAHPLWDMQELNRIVKQLITQGWENRVITWLAKNASKDYKKAIRKAKKEWLQKYGFPVQKIHAIAYGTPKTRCVKKVAEYAVLVDDNEEVRKAWTLGATIDPTAVDLIEELRRLL